MNYSQVQARNRKFNNRFNALRKFIDFKILKYAAKKTKSDDVKKFEINHSLFKNDAIKLLEKIEDVFSHEKLSELKIKIFDCIDFAKECKKNDFNNFKELETKIKQTSKFSNEVQKIIYDEMTKTNWMGIIIFFFIVVIIGVPCFIFFSLRG